MCVFNFVLNKWHLNLYANVYYMFVCVLVCVWKNKSKMVARVQSITQHGMDKVELLHSVSMWDKANNITIILCIICMFGAINIIQKIPIYICVLTMLTLYISLHPTCWSPDFNNIWQPTIKHVNLRNLKTLHLMDFL